MSHLHFPANEDAAERIERWEKTPSECSTGRPYIDMITRVRKKSFAELQERYSLREVAKLVLFTQHPVTTEYGDGISQVLKTIDALGRFNDVHVIALFSNADAGGRRIIERLQQESYSIHPSIPHEDFLSLMSIADVMVGNSSAGIREAPSFGLPVVNIGTRQAGRLRAANIIDVPYEADAIAAALERALYDEAFRKACERCENPYGTPGAAKRIVDVLESVELNLDLLQKQISDPEDENGFTSSRPHSRARRLEGSPTEEPQAARRGAAGGPKYSDRTRLSKHHRSLRVHRRRGNRLGVLRRRRQGALSKAG